MQLRFSAASKAKVIEAGTIEAILKVINAHPEDSGINVCGYEAIRELVYDEGKEK